MKMNKQYFCSFIAIKNGKIIAYGDHGISIEDTVETVDDLAGIVRSDINRSNYKDSEVGIVLTALNRVELD